jgi:cellulose synthase operon protein C
MRLAYHSFNMTCEEPMRELQQKPVGVLSAFFIALMGLIPMAFAAPISVTAHADLPSAHLSSGGESLKRGLALMERGDLVTAEQALNESIKLDPGMVEAFLALAELRLRQNNLQGAEAFVRKALVSQPDSPNALVALGNIQLLEKNGEKAEVSYRQALTIDKANVSAFIGLGELYLRVLNQPKQAIAAFRRACAISPNLATAHFALGTAYATAKQSVEAIAEFKVAAKLVPTDPQPQHAIGRLQANDKKLDLAVMSFTSALKANPDYLPARIDRADVFAELEHNKEAHADYEMVIAKQPDDAQLWLKLGLINERLGRQGDAVKAYQTALKFNPNMPLAYNNLAWMVVGEKGNLDQALAWARKATTLAPSVPQFYDTLGWIHHARGELAEARRSLETAAGLTPPQADVQYHLGVVLQEQGHKKEATVAFGQALNIDKSFAHAADIGKRLADLSK